MMAPVQWIAEIQSVSTTCLEGACDWPRDVRLVSPGDGVIIDRTDKYLGAYNEHFSRKKST